MGMVLGKHYAYDGTQFQCKKCGNAVRALEPGEDLTVQDMRKRQDGFIRRHSKCWDMEV